MAIAENIPPCGMTVSNTDVAAGCNGVNKGSVPSHSRRRPKTSGAVMQIIHRRLDTGHRS